MNKAFNDDLDCVRKILFNISKDVMLSYYGIKSEEEARGFSYLIKLSVLEAVVAVADDSKESIGEEISQKQALENLVKGFEFFTKDVKEAAAVLETCLDEYIVVQASKLVGDKNV